jgi:hypothetical protein
MPRVENAVRIYGRLQSTMRGEIVENGQHFFLGGELGVK